MDSHTRYLKPVSHITNPPPAWLYMLDMGDLVRRRLLPHGLEDVQHLPDVAVLGLEAAGEPAALVAESHVDHRLQRNLDLRVGVRNLGRSGRRSCGCCWRSFNSLGRLIRLGKLGIHYTFGVGVEHLGYLGLVLHQGLVSVLGGRTRWTPGLVL